MIVANIRFAASKNIYAYLYSNPQHIKQASQTITINSGTKVSAAKIVGLTQVNELPGRVTKMLKVVGCNNNILQCEAIPLTREQYRQLYRPVSQVSQQPQSGTATTPAVVAAINKPKTTTKLTWISKISELKQRVALKRHSPEFWLLQICLTLAIVCVVLSLVFYPY